MTVLALLLSATVICGTETAPIQTGLDTTVVVPPRPGIYPVQVGYFTPDVVSLSLVKWAHHVAATVPAGGVQFRGYIDRLPWPEGAPHNAVLVDLFANDGTGVPHTVALSTPLAPNERYLVWVGHPYGTPVPIHLTIGLWVCRQLLRDDVSGPDH